MTHRERLLGSFVLAGLVLALLELGVALVWGWRFFLSVGELGRYALASSLSLVAASCFVGGLAWGLARLASLRSADSVRRLRWAATALSAAAAFGVLWLLTEGRRVRDLPGRALWVLAASLLLGWLGGVLVARYRRWLEDRVSPGFADWALLGGVLVGAPIVDRLVLPRLYPAFHFGLTLLAVLAALAVARLLWPRLGSVRLARAAPWVALGALALSPVALGSVADAPNARFAVERAAPLTGKILRLSGLGSEPGAAAPAAQPPVQAAAASHEARGVDLRGRDVLLISIDALRVDRLRAHGGSGVTPNLDALAEQAVVFTRAYTPTPHTSYALSSMLTGKFLKPIIEMGGSEARHPTLPDILRRYGYRTAAFYPPAIFFVDEQRFARFSEENYGFEYVKVMFADGRTRARQLQEYLAGAPGNHPVFAWVHLFEPHEPYETHERFARGDSAVERYDSEVAAADEAVGQLVERFRRARPGGVVIVTADHGEEFGDHGGYYHGTTLYEEQARVPLVWWSPGDFAPGRVAAPAELVDIATTLLSMLGIPRDARMRGDDLGPLLRAERGTGPPFAFAETDELRMVTDGRYKAICQEGIRRCELYDLKSDPAELRDVAAREAGALTRLREALAAFIASIPETEALALDEQVGWPETLARARLGDPSVAPELVPLLGAPQAAVRAEAARMCGELRYRPALPVLARLREEDDAALVRAEAAVAQLTLDEEAALDAVRRVVSAHDRPLALRRRAALLLAERGDPLAFELTRALAADEEADERWRKRAIVALGALGDRRARPVLQALLEDARLGPSAASALGELGDRRAIGRLLSVAREVRYPTTRRAQARALIQLGAHRQAARLIRRFLGTETSIPDGVAMLQELGRLSPPTARGAVVSNASVRRGQWNCSQTGCRPGEGARLRLPPGRPRGPARVVLLARAAGETELVIDGERRLPLRSGLQEIGFEADPSSGPRELALGANEALELLAVAVVPKR